MSDRELFVNEPEGTFVENAHTGEKGTIIKKKPKGYLIQFQDGYQYIPYTNKNQYKVIK